MPRPARSSRAGGPHMPPFNYNAAYPFFTGLEGHLINHFKEAPDVASMHVGDLNSILVEQGNEFVKEWLKDHSIQWGSYSQAEGDAFFFEVSANGSAYYGYLRMSCNSEACYVKFKFSRYPWNIKIEEICKGAGRAMLKKLSDANRGQPAQGGGSQYPEAGSQGGGGSGYPMAMDSEGGAGTYVTGTTFPLEDSSTLPELRPFSSDAPTGASLASYDCRSKYS
jgi:hypothetical protein